MACGCKKNKSHQVQPQPLTINLNGVPTPVVTQPAPIVSDNQQNQIVDNLNKIQNQ